MHKRITITGVLFFILFFGISQTVSAFGISPPAIRESRLVPGSTVTRTISLVQGNPTAPTDVEVTVDSKDMRDWMSFDPGLEFEIPAGVQQFPFMVTIAVPEDAELGNYSAFVRIRTRPKPAEDAGSVAVATGARLDVDITVGDNVIEEYQVVTFSIEDVYENHPLKARTTIENTGNVPTGPKGATFELFDKFGNVRLGFVMLEEEDIGTVEAFTQGSLTMEFPLDIRIAPGEYRGDVKLLNEDGSVVREIKTPFEVRERTFLVILIDVALYIVGIFIILVVLLIWLWVNHRKRRKKGMQMQNGSVHKMTDIQKGPEE